MDTRSALPVRLPCILPILVSVICLPSPANAVPPGGGGHSDDRGGRRGNSAGGHSVAGHPSSRHSGQSHAGRHFGWLHFGFGKHSLRRREFEVFSSSATLTDSLLIYRQVLTGHSPLCRFSWWFIVQSEGTPGRTRGKSSPSHLKKPIPES